MRWQRREFHRMCHSAHRSRRLRSFSVAPVLVSNFRVAVRSISRGERTYGGATHHGSSLWQTWQPLFRKYELRPLIGTDGGTRAQIDFCDHDQTDSKPLARRNFLPTSKALAVRTLTLNYPVMPALAAQRCRRQQAEARRYPADRTPMRSTPPSFVVDADLGHRPCEGQEADGQSRAQQ